MNEKSEQSKRIIKKYMWLSMGAGVVPIPILDVAAVTGVQLKMISDLAGHFGIPFSRHTTHAIIGSLTGSITAGSAAKGVVGSAVKAIPILGTLTAPFLMPTLSGAATYALGLLFIQHFEAGGTFLNFDPEKTREYFNMKFQEGIKEARCF